MTDPDITPQLMLWAFPPADTPRLAEAYNLLFLAAHGSPREKEQIGDPALLARPWDPATCHHPALRAEIWAWLDAVVSWINHEYVWDHTVGMIPPCWPQHPHLVHEIAVLADGRRRASLDVTSNTLEEWHRYCLPAFFERLRGRIKNGCDEQHSKWPAQSRYTGRHLAAAPTATRDHAYRADIATCTPPAPADDEADSAGEPQRPTLRVVHDGDDTIDTSTGEVLT